MKTLFLEITEEGLTYRTEKGEARLLQVGDTVTLLHPSGVNLRVELAGDYRAQRSQAARCQPDKHDWIEQPAGGPIEVPFTYCSACGALGDAAPAFAPVTDPKLAAQLGPSSRPSTSDGDPLVSFELVDEEPKPEPESLKPIPPEGVPF